MPYQSVSDFPVDVMMNQFDLSSWNDNDESDLYERGSRIKIIIYRNFFSNFWSDRRTENSIFPSPGVG